MAMSNPWTLLLLAISAEVIGTSCLRLSEGMTKPVPTLLVFLAYAIAMALLSKVVLSIPLGITYALWSGIGTVVIATVASLFALYSGEGFVALLGAFAQADRAYSFFFGTSQSSADKTALLATRPDGTETDPVHTQEEHRHA